jgi:uncharacterized membrane protein YfcA
LTGIKALVGLAPLTFAGAAAMTFGAAYVRGLTGFGMAIILVPLLGMIVPPGQAVVVAIILQLLIGPVGLRVILADADRHTAVPIGLIAMATTPLGMLALKAITPDVARLMITLVAVGAFLAILMPKQPEGHRPGRVAIGGTGIASGHHLGGRHFGRVPAHLWQAMVAVVLGLSAISAVVRILN